MRAPLSGHRRPTIPYTDAPRGTCRWCGEAILHGPGPKQGQADLRRRWHPHCVETYNATDARELRRLARKRDRAICRACGLDTNALKREVRGRGRAAKLRALGFPRRRSLWELDHIVPLIDGGSHELSNLQTLCAPCHRKKTGEENRARARSGAKQRPREPDLEDLFKAADEINARAEALLSKSY